MTGLYVQFGCGLSAPDGWLNFDASPTLRIQKLPLIGRLAGRLVNAPDFPGAVRYGDIVTGLPVAPGSCAGVYASHVLEHLALEDLRRALRNTHRMLIQGGVFRIVLPDLEHIAKEYLASADERAALVFMNDTSLGQVTRPRGPGAAARSWLGNSSHLWMWDYKSLARELTDAGFGAVRRASLGDSVDSYFASVEDPGRWENQLGIEAIR